MLYRIVILVSVLHICLINAEYFARDGIGYVWGSDAVYYAVDYEPVCGVMADGLTTPIDFFYCKTAIVYYKASNKPYGTFSDLGIETNNMPGDGDSFCFCFSLKDTGGKKGDFCIAVAADGQQISGYGGSRGQFMPASDKALPACPDVNIASISATHSRTTPTPPPISTGYYSGSYYYAPKTVTLTPTIATFPTGTQTIVSTLSGGSVTTMTRTLFSTAPVMQTGYRGSNSGHTLSRSDSIAISVWVGLVIQAAILVFL